MKSQYCDETPLDILKGILAFFAVPAFLCTLGVLVEWLTSLQ
jgi:hypothetical protein